MADASTARGGGKAGSASGLRPVSDSAPTGEISRATLHNVRRTVTAQSDCTTSRSSRQRRLEQRDVRGVQVRAVEREAVGERLAVGREELVEEVEPVQAGRGLLGAAQRGVRVRVR